MATQAQAIIEDLYHVPDSAEAEIVNRELILISSDTCSGRRQLYPEWAQLEE
jgi:hypothetical protein